MKPNVLVATQDSDFKAAIKAQVGSLCNITSTPSTASLLMSLIKKQYDGLIVDTRTPGLDGGSVLHALAHVADPGFFVVSAGLFDPMTTLGAQKIVRWVSSPRSARSIGEVLRAFFDPASARTIREAHYQEKEDVFFIAFRDGKTYEMARNKIEDDDGTPVVDVRVEDGGDAFIVRQKSGNTYDVAWDFVLYHQEPRYPYYKGKAEQRQGEARRAHRIGERVRGAREDRGWSLVELAKRAGMHRPNLHRLETGKHLPSLDTLERVAAALGVRVVDLVAA